MFIQFCSALKYIWKWKWQWIYNKGILRYTPSYIVGFWLTWRRDSQLGKQSLLPLIDFLSFGRSSFFFLCGPISRLIGYLISPRDWRIVETRRSAGWSELCSVNPLFVRRYNNRSIRICIRPSVWRQMRPSVPNTWYNMVESYWQSDNSFALSPVFEEIMSFEIFINKRIWVFFYYMICLQHGTTAIPTQCSQRRVTISALLEGEGHLAG